MQTSPPGPDYRIGVFGDSGVGKTSIVIRYCWEEFVQEYDPTIEDSFRVRKTIDGRPYLLEILDTAGQEGFQNLRDSWIRGCDGFLLVYSVTSKASFSSIRCLLEDIIQVKGWNPEDQLPIVIAGNKCDDQERREVRTTSSHSLAKERGCLFIETSAKENINIGKGPDDVVKMLRRSGSLASWKAKRGGCHCIFM